MASLLEIRESKAAYSRACNTLRSLEKSGAEHAEREGVILLPSPLARRIERQRRDVRELELRLIRIGCENAIPVLRQGEEVIRDARYF